MKGLALFRKTNCERLWNIASFHSPHSLTWRWILAFGLFRGDERRLWPLVMWHRNNTGIEVWVRVPWAGMFTFKTQHPMWFRDLYRDKRAEEDRASYERYLARSQKRNAVPMPPTDIGYTYH